VRALVLTIYALVFVTELGQSGIVPLLPLLGRELDLSGVETGALLAATTVVTVALAVPIGMLADRFGAYRLTLGSGAVMALAAAGQAFAPDFWALLACRALFGVGFAAIWTAGLSLISNATRARRAAAVGGTIAVGGAAHFVGPSASGFLAEHAGVPAPFLVLAGLSVAVTAALALQRAPAVEAQPHEQLRSALRAVRRGAELRGAVVVMALVGVVSGTVPLLVPLALDENGLSPGEIGAVFSASALVWIAASAAVARLGARAVHLGAAAIAAAALTATFVVPAVTAATAGVAAFLILRAAAQAPLSTIAYPLGETGARIAGIGGGTAIGLLNVVWGATAAVSPLAAGALTGAVGTQATFALLAGCCAVSGISIGLTARRAPRLQPAAGS
jgi:MFS family permease